MDIYESVMGLEDGELSGEDEARSIQSLINSGTWGLQGRFGRTMMDAIEAGICALGTEPASDYYGNPIPSRSEVEPGTKGSVEFVEQRSPYGGVLE